MPYSQKVCGRTVNKKCLVSETRTLSRASQTAVNGCGLALPPVNDSFPPVSLSRVPLHIDCRLFTHIDKTSEESNFIIYTQEKLILFRNCEAHFNTGSFIVDTELYMKEIILS